MKFYIEDDDFIVYHVDEKMFRKLQTIIKNWRSWGTQNEKDID